MDNKTRDEIEKCKDPVYFYENYFTVDGKPPAPLDDYQKGIMRELIKIRKEKGISIIHIHPRGKE